MRPAPCARRDKIPLAAGNGTFTRAKPAMRPYSHSADDGALQPARARREA